MVQLEEVADEEFKKPLVDDEEDWEGTDDESDAGSDLSDDVSERGLSLRGESLWDRISALRDIVPPSTRRSLVHTWRTASSYAFGGGRVAGKLAWAVVTSALLVGLPYTLALEDEHKFVQQEKEYYAQQQGAQQMMSNPYGQPAQPGAQGQQPGGAPAGGIRPPGF